MRKSVAGEPFAFAGERFPARPFSEDEPAASSVDGGRIRIDRDAIYRKMLSSPIKLREDETFLSRLIERIRAFIARIFRAIFGVRGGVPTDSGSPSLKDAGGAPLDGIAYENEREMVTHPLPASAAESVQQSVNELIDRSLGVDLSPSVKAAMAMPEMDRKPTFRVLLQDNLEDTASCRTLCNSLRGAVEQSLAPFAARHGMDAAAALRILRADLDNVRDGKGGGLIANKMDSDGEIRGHIAELARLEASLGALARSRGLIGERAVATGAFSRDELAGLLRAHGHDVSFLREAPDRGNVVSMAQFRSTTVRAPHGEAANESTHAVGSDTLAAANVVELVREAHEQAEASGRAAVGLMVEQGVIDSAPETAESLGRAMAVSDALGDETEFESDWSGDDFAAFRKTNSDVQPKLKI